MAKGRLISGNLSTSRRFESLRAKADEQKEGLGEFAQLLWVLCYAHVDNFGRFDDDPWTIKARVMPLSTRPLDDFKTCVSLWHDVGLNEILQDAEGNTCTYFRKFEETQGSFLNSRTRPEFLPNFARNSEQFRRKVGNRWESYSIGSGSGSVQVGSCSHRLGSENSDEESESSNQGALGSQKPGKKSKAGLPPGVSSVNPKNRFEHRGSIRCMGQVWSTASGDTLGIGRHDKKAALFIVEPVTGWSRIRYLKPMKGDERE